MDLSNAITAFNAAKQAGFTGTSLAIAVAIAGAESGFDTKAIGDVILQDSKWGPSVGLWQIRSLKNPSAWPYPDNMRDATKLTDPVYNAQAAYAISKKGNDFSPWSTFVNKTYQTYLDVVNQVEQLAITASGPLTIIELLLMVIIGYKLFFKK